LLALADVKWGGRCSSSSVVDCVVAMIEVEVWVVVGVGEVALPVVVFDVGEGEGGDVDEGGKVESKVVVDSHLNEQGQILGIGSAA